MLESKLNTNKTLAGIFEFEDNAGYFYLYFITNKEDKKILNHIHISNNINDFLNKKIDIKWSRNQEKVVLFIDNTAWAMFNVKNNEKFNKKEINDSILELF